MALFAVDMYGARLVPGLFRLLTHWPAYLAHVAVELLPLFERPDFVKICHDIVHRIDYVMPIVIDVIVTVSPPFDAQVADQLRGSLGVCRGRTSSQMIVFSILLRDALLTK